MINCVCGIRSTGRICTDLAQMLEAEGHEVKIAYGRVDEVPDNLQKYAVRIGNEFGIRLHAVQSRLFDNHGWGSYHATKSFLKWAEDFNPEVVWLHNIHGYYIHVELLFQWLAKRNQKTYWTLHDCWAFTGHCAHFDYVGCERWKTQCEHCIQLKEYPKSMWADCSAKNWKRKKELFTSLADMHLFTPSKWLADRVKESFLGHYPITVCPNGIDLEQFRPIKSDIKKEYQIDNKKILLGVSTVWYEKKGYSQFLELAEMLPEEWQIVLVGVSDAQKQELPPNITGIPRTNSIDELAKWYTAADYFVNPSFEETMGLTTVEALACGTPAIVYNKTALPEVLSEESGIILKNCSAKAIKDAVAENRVFKPEACIAQAREYEKEKRYQVMIDIILGN